MPAKPERGGPRRRVNILVPTLVLIGVLLLVGLVLAGTGPFTPSS